MSRNHLLKAKRIVTDDGVSHRPFDLDGNGVTFVCDLYDHTVKYLELRRVPWNDLVDSTVLNCLVCLLAAEANADDDELAFTTFVKILKAP